MYPILSPLHHTRHTHCKVSQCIPHRSTLYPTTNCKAAQCNQHVIAKAHFIVLHTAEWHDLPNKWLHIFVHCNRFHHTVRLRLHCKVAFHSILTVWNPYLMLPYRDLVRVGLHTISASHSMLVFWAHVQVIMCTVSCALYHCLHSRCCSPALKSSTVALQWGSLSRFQIKLTRHAN